MYATVLTRPDIAFDVSQVAKFTSHPHNSHWIVVKRIFQYLSDTIHMGISYNSSNVDLTLRGYCDADYASDQDDRKSRRYMQRCYCMVQQKQGCTADSNTEAEFVAMAESVKEAIWLRCLLHSLGFPSSTPTSVFSDNQGAIQLMKNPKFHKRTRHIETKYYVIPEKNEQQQIDVSYINTKQQLADLLTKPLPHKAFQHLCTLQGIVAPPFQTSGSTLGDVRTEQQQHAHSDSSTHRQQQKGVNTADNKLCKIWSFVFTTHERSKYKCEKQKG